MRIVLLITMGIERPSGVRYFSLAREFVRRGHQVRILALHPDLESCAERRFVRDGVEVWYVGQMHAGKRDSIPQRFSPFQLFRVLLMSTWGMIWGVFCSAADVYHLGKPQPINGVAALCGIVAVRRRRFYVDCDDDEVGSNRFSANWQRLVFAFWQWLLPRLAYGVTVNTQFLAERMRRAGIANVVYVPNGVDLALFERPPAAVVSALQRALGLDGRSVIAYAGTLALHNHPVDLLLDAFAEVARARADLELLVIGGGEDLPLLRQRSQALNLENRVHFTGHLPYTMVRAFLALADVSADPVYDDEVARARSPLKIVESMALGVPVVTGNVGDRPQMLAQGAGVTVAPGDAHALARGVAQLLADPAVLEATSERALAAAQHYNWSNLSDSWVKVYDLGQGRELD